jgi:SAM-dependent methyltransferase
MNRREETIDYYDHIAEKSFKDWFNNPALLPTLKDFIDNLPKNPLILDLGCGTGGESKRLIELGANVIGIDLSRKSIQYAIDNIPKGKFFIMDILKMEFEKEQFDGIMEAGVLFHFTEEEQKVILKKIFSILKTNGIFISYYPEGNYEGMEEFHIGEKTYRRYARKTTMDIWGKNVEAAGFKKYRRLEFSIGTFKAIEFQKKNYSYSIKDN